MEPTGPPVESAPVSHTPRATAIKPDVGMQSVASHSTPGKGQAPASRCQAVSYTSRMPRTMFEKVWDDHLIGDDLLFVDLHLVHEVTSPQAFEGLRLAGRRVRRPDRTLATADHNVPTGPGEPDELSRAQLEALRVNCEEFG